MTRGLIASTLRTGIVLTLLASAARAANPPTGFQEDVVFTGLTNPTQVRFLPDGRVLVAEKSGLLKMFASLDATTPTVVADLRTNVHNFWDRGLLGLAVDPDFANNGYVYVAYAFDAPIGGTPPLWGQPGVSSDGCPTPPGATTDGCVISARVSRFSISGGTAGPEQVLIEDWCQQYPSHSIGSLAFGADGYLYVSGGDGASFNYSDYGQGGGGSGSPTPKNPCGDPPAGVGGSETPPTAEGGALRSQSLRRAAGEPVVLSGTVLRVDPATGAAAPDNPLAGNANANARRIVGYGFRNPFRFTIKPGTNDIYIGDVGWSTTEEIDRIPDPLTPTVRNFGWPCYEGTPKQPGYDAANLNLCESLYATPGAVTGPLYSYAHTAAVVSGDGCPTGSSSISGMAFYNGGTYPANYQNALFFADYSRACIWVMFPDANGVPDPNNRMAWKSAAAGPVDIQVGPSGDIFYADFDGGTIRRYQYLGPIAIATASPDSGAPPLSVQFDGSESQPGSPDDTLTFAWDLDGDGNFNDSTDPQPVFVYATKGSYHPRLRVTDNHGATTVSTALTINVDTQAPTASITQPGPNTTWKVGDTISFKGHAVDPQQGNLPPSAMSWQVIIHHCPSNCHTHVYETFDGVDTGSFPAPDHEYPSYLELRLTATDSSGVSSTASENLDPQTVDLTFQTSPPGLELAVGPDSGTTPFTRSVIIGSQNSLSAPSPQGSFGFTSWSDGGAQNHNITAPDTPATYTATYTSTGLPSPWAQADIGAVGLPGDGSFSSGAFNVSASGADIWGTADSFHFVYQALNGNGTIVARVASIQNTSAWAKAGVMIRESLAANARNAFMAVTPVNGLAFQRRTATAGTSVTTAVTGFAAPYWVKLQRSGSTFTASRSADGVTWTVVGTASITMATNVYFGLALTSHNNTALNTSSFDGVSANSPPTVNITSPSSGATFTSPATITIQASASDNGSVAKVDFYNGATLIGTATTAPYSFDWTSVPDGTYSLTAKATDDVGAVGTSAPVTVIVSSGGGPIPAPWVEQDIGAVGVAGSSSWSTGTFVARGSGADIWSTADAFHFVYQPVSGNSTIIARVASIQNTSSWAKAGVMIRESLAAGARNAYMAVSYGNGLTFQQRTATNGTSVSTAVAGLAAPYWVKLQRSGSTFTASRSADGVTWTVVGTASITMATNVYVGLAVTSHNNAAVCASVFDTVSVASNLPPTVTITSPSTGATYTSPATVSITADASDSDGVAQVDFYNGATLIGSATTAPYSFDWTSVPDGTYSLTAKATDTLGDSSTSGPVTVTVSSGGWGGVPAPWAEQDIGAVGVPGSSSYSAGTFVASGSGADIWGTADAFHFVYQPLNGNGSIVARVAGIQNTSLWAKAGVMIRDGLAAGARNAYMAVSYGSGLTFQRRTSTNGTSVSTAVTGFAAPYWVKLRRSGSTFTAYRSADGVTWTVVGTASITMATNIYVGLAVTSHNNAAACSSILDNVYVNLPPAVSVTSPTSGTTYTSPATVSIAASASDPDGVTKVDFYNGATLIGTSTTAPYSFDWTNVGAGTYNLTAKATDTLGDSATSASITVAVSSGGWSGVPAPWAEQDIGAVGVAGSSSYSAGTFVASGSGTDIWSTADAFHFVYQPLVGNGTIIARVASIQNTSSWAKSGVMIRDGLAAGARNAYMAVSYGNGLTFQRRTATNGTSVSTASTGLAAPYWVKLQRSGSTFTASRSADGVTWTVVGTASVTMATNVYVGLAVTSHNNAAVCASILDSVTVTSP
jgi:glucose/arabinose dehydrogenase/regulation of enolase protein 1 (concanavalin A-like superfamily)